MSNILDVFNPPPAGNVDRNPQDCIPCTLVQAALALGGGLYLYSGMPFMDSSGKIDVSKHPLWWQRTVRATLVVVIALGAYRLGEAGVLAYEKWQHQPRD